MPEVYYAIRKAQQRGQGKRATFKIDECWEEAGRVRTRRLTLPELDAINARYSKGSLPFEDALKACEALREQLYAKRDKTKPKRYFTEANRKVLDDYWAAKYAPKLHKLQDPDSMWHDLNRAVGACGEISLLVASQDALQNKIDTDHWTSPNKQRRIVARLNSLLRWLGRDFQLDKAPEEYEDIRYLTLVEFERFVGQLPDPTFALLCRVAFGTGCRVGEVFGLRPDARKGARLRVVGQLTAKLAHKKTKNRRVRTARILPGFEGYVDEWLALPPEAKATLRAYNHARTVGRVCAAIWPNDPSKHCTFHDLRHSYAIYLSGKGAPIKQVAECLGNSPTVCEKYYQSFQLTDYGLDLLDKLLGPSPI